MDKSCPVVVLRNSKKIRWQFSYCFCCVYVRVRACVRVCVCVCVCVELLKRSKTCTSITLAIIWQFMNLFRGAALTSGFSHVHLFMFLCLLKQF